jgi:hypothetical protein
VSESAELAATQEAAVAFVASINELAALTAQEFAQTAYNVSRSEAAIITETQNGRFFWEPVDDIQDANWQNITNTQSTTWVDVVTQES